MGGGGDYVVDYSGSGKKQQLDRCVRIIPDKEGEYMLRIAVYSDSVCLTYKKTNVIVKNPEYIVESDEEDNVLIIGDSTTANGVMINNLSYECQKNNLKVGFVGTQGDNVHHEGRSGWTIEKYLTDSESPFMFGGKLSFKKYIRDNKLNSPDYVILNLGINDVFGEKDDILLHEKVEEFYEYYLQLIDSIKSYDKDIVIGISIPIPPADSESAFGKAYTWQTQWRYKKNNMYLSQILMERFEDEEGLSIIPIYLGIDTEYNMGMEDRNVNSKSSVMIKEIPSDGSVHPDKSGYSQIADEYLSWLIYMKSCSNVKNVNLGGGAPK